MTRLILDIPEVLHRRLLAHLLPDDSKREQAAFLFCRQRDEDGALVFETLESEFLSSGDFAAQYSDYIELTDSCRIGLIKRAHRLDAILAEFHSHPSPWPARFSISDRIGLRETVRHMRWRLPGRPYLSLVIAPSGFDALVWLPGNDKPAALTGIRAGHALHRPTNNSLQGWDHHEYERQV